jgi:hypothetical protein
LYKRPGGDSIHLSLEEIRQRVRVHCPFYDKFDRVRLRICLAVMKKMKGNRPMVKDMTLVLRHRH